MTEETQIISGIEKEHLPNDWAMATIGNLVKVRNGFAFKSKDYQEEGVLLIRQTNLGGDRISLKKAKYLPKKYLDEYSDFQIRKGDILIGMSGSVGKLCTYNLDEPALQNQRTGLLQFIDDQQKRWVWHYLPLLENELLKASKGVAVQNISSSKIESFSIPIAPTGQQKRIVAEIEKQFSRLDEAVSNLKRVKANLKRYKAAVLKASVEGKLTEQWRKVNPNVEPANKLLERILTERRKKWEENELAKMKAKGKEPKDDKWKAKYKEIPNNKIGDILQIEEIPNTWLYLSLGNVIDEPKYGTSKKCNYEDNGIGVLRIPNVVDGFINATDLKFAEFDNKEIETYALNDGDVLTIRSNGSVSLVGKCALVTTQDEKYLYAGYLIRLRPYCKVVNSKYLMIVFESLLLRKQIESKAKSTSGVNNINSGELQSLIIPICNIDEQNQIVELVTQKLSVIEHLGIALDNELKRAERLRQSILSKAFSGQLLRSKKLDDSELDSAVVA